MLCIFRSDKKTLHLRAVPIQQMSSIVINNDLFKSLFDFLNLINKKSMKSLSCQSTYICPILNINLNSKYNNSVTRISNQIMNNLKQAG